MSTVEEHLNKLMKHIDALEKAFPGSINRAAVDEYCEGFRKDYAAKEEAVTEVVSDFDNSDDSEGNGPKLYDYTGEGMDMS